MKLQSLLGYTSLAQVLTWTTLASAGISSGASQSARFQSQPTEPKPIKISLQSGDCATFGQGTLCNFSEGAISFLKSGGELLSVELGTNGKASYIGNISHFSVTGSLASQFSVKGDYNVISVDFGCATEGDGGMFLFGGNGNHVDNLFDPAAPKANTRIVIWDPWGDGNTYDNHGEKGNTVLIQDATQTFVTMTTEGD